MEKKDLLYKLTGTEEPKFITEREKIMIDKFLEILNQESIPKQVSVEPEVMPNEVVAGVNKALDHLIAAIYFDDSSDYLSAIWDAIKEIDIEAYNLLTEDKSAAYGKYCKPA